MATGGGADEESGARQGRLMPSAFMRRLRPECYSDSAPRRTAKLDKTLLEYRLETLTARNETHAFEIFCRRLCERTICPNLRPQTGPDGGGDSKADTETFPVSEEIAELTYFGETGAARERWAFAFSAKKTWAEKVRRDVKGIVATNRGYARIYCVTSRFARAKDRARVEDELSREHDVPVTILDRVWIVNEVIDNKREDLAINYLGVGDAIDAREIGPDDQTRMRQLEEIERAIAEPERFRGMERHLVTEALVAARLSRNLEVSRAETDGRFARAIRLAERHGTYQQRLEARYEQIWTAFWWFDDFDQVLSAYDGFEAQAVKSTHAKALELLGNVHQLLVNAVVHGHQTREACQYDARTSRVAAALETAAADLTRPNNSLEARVGLLRIELNRALIDDDRTALPGLWQSYAQVIDRAGGLGEFDADGLARYIEVAGEVAGNDPAYNDLVERLAAFMAARRSEAEGALILLRRARKLDFTDKLDMIRWLGKAAYGLVKREHAEALVEAHQLLALAYRSAGLPWAARASCALALATLMIQSEEEGELPVGIVPTTKLWGWVALELRHLPDLLLAVQLLKGFAASLPLDQPSQQRLGNDIRELEMGLGCLLLNLQPDELSRLDELPDILDRLGLHTARIGLLFALGHEEVLRSEGTIPDTETSDDALRLVSMLKHQPIVSAWRGTLVLNGDGRQTLSTILIGMRLEVEIGSSDLIALAEGVVASLEAFFATVIDKRVAPHTELFRIVIEASDAVRQPVIETSELDMTLTVSWPCTIDITAPSEVDVRDFYCELAGHVLGAACWVSDASQLVSKLCRDEAMLHRIAMVAVAPNSYSRFTARHVVRLTDWKEYVRRRYPLQQERSGIPPRDTPERSKAAQPADRDGASKEEIVNHREVAIRSVIDVHAWDRATWRGCAYFVLPGRAAPVMALVFEDMTAARKIFERWRARLGAMDADDEIAISIVRALPGAGEHHYIVQVASKSGGLTDANVRIPVLTATRSLVMEATTSRHLEMFVSHYRAVGKFDLVAGVGVPGVELQLDLAIGKTALRVRQAAEVCESDLEWVALRGLRLKQAS